jgi:hypothetical protein
VLTLLVFTSIFIEAVVNRILEHPVILCPRQRRSFSVSEAEVIHRLGNPVEGVFAGCVQLKGFSNEWCSLRIGCDCLRLRIIAVARWRHARPNAILQFLPQGPVDVLAEIVNVILRLAKHNCEQEFSCRRWFKRERRKFEVGQVTGFNEVHDLPAVISIPSETIRMPRENARRLSVFDTFEHGVEERPARTLGCHLLLDYFEHVEVLPPSQFAEFRNLILNGPDLPRQVVGRFAGVNKKGLTVHAASLARRFIGAKGLLSTRSVLCQANDPVCI